MKTSPRMRHCLPPPCYGHRLLTSVWILQFIGTNCVCSACEMSAHSCSHFSKETLSPLRVLRSCQRSALKNRFNYKKFKLKKDKYLLVAYSCYLYTPSSFSKKLLRWENTKLRDLSAWLLSSGLATQRWRTAWALGRPSNPAFSPSCFSFSLVTSEYFGVFNQPLSLMLLKVIQHYFSVQFAHRLRRQYITNSATRSQQI